MEVKAALDIALGLFHNQRVGLGERILPSARYLPGDLLKRLPEIFCAMYRPGLVAPTAVS